MTDMYDPFIEGEHDTGVHTLDHPNRGLAAIFNVGRNSLMAWMRAKGILNASNHPSFELVTLRYAYVKPSRQWKDADATWWTPEGLTWLSDKILAAINAGELKYKKPPKFIKENVSMPQGLIDGYDKVTHKTVEMFGIDD